jgi:amino acid transporter
MPKAQSELPRVLNASHATSIVVGIIIGSGIFLVPREMMAAVGSSRAVYAVWIVGGLLSLFGAMTYAEMRLHDHGTAGSTLFSARPMAILLASSICGRRSLLPNPLR